MIYEKKLKNEIKMLGIPILIEQILITSMGVINTMLASNLEGNEGMNVVSAISMIDQFSYLFIAMFSALAVGGTVVVAQYIGRMDEDRASEVAFQAIVAGTLVALALSIILSILNVPLVTFIYQSVDSQVIGFGIRYFAITLLSYPFLAITLIGNGVLRGAGDSKTAAISNVLMNILNIMFTYYLLYVIDLGVTGAALGISLARFFGAVYVLRIMMSGKKKIKMPSWVSYRPNFIYLKQLVYVGIPAGIESMIFNFGKLFTQIFIGGMGTIALSSNSIAGSIMVLINIPGTTLSTVATTIIGQEIGRGDGERARGTLMYLTKFATICLTVFAALSIPLAGFLVGLYTDNTEVIAYTTRLIILNAFATPLWAFSFVLPGGLKGAGDGKYTMTTAIIGMWAFRVAFGYVLGVVFKLGVAGIYIGMYIDWAVRGIMYYLRLRGDKWLNHHLIEDEVKEQETTATC
ncbi:MAG: MATE family efflux transporter [Turicibacter sp.]